MLTSQVTPGTALCDAEEAMRLADLAPDRALPVAALAARRAHRERDAAAATIAERAWGHSLVHCGKIDDAIRHFRKAITCGERAGSPSLAAEARMTLAFALMQRGRPGPALTEIDAALLVLDGTSGARARAQRAIILHQGGRLDEALAEFQAALPTLRRAGDLLGIQKMLINRAYLQADRHAFASAHADLIEAEGLARQLGRDLTIGIIAENLGLVESVRGDVPAALAHFSRAEQIIGAHGAQLGHVYQHRAELLLSVGLVAEAREVAERAALAFRHEGRLLKLSEVRLLLSQAAFLDRDWQAAITHARQAKREFTRQQRVEWSWLAQLAVLRAQLASGVRVQVANRDVDTMLEILSASGWPAAALEARLAAARIAARRGSSWTEQAHLRQASLIASQPGPATLRARGWYGRALLRQRYGDSPAALRGVRAGLRILDEHSAVLGTADLRAHAAVHRAELTELGLRIALESGRPGAVFEWAERGRASQLMHRAVLPPDDPELARMLSELRSTAGELDRLRDSGRGGAALARRQIALERQIRDHCRLHRGTSDGRLPAPVSPGRLGRQLGGWALVEFVELDGVLRCLSVVDGRLRMREVGSAAQIADLVERLSFALHRMARRDGRAQSRSAAVTLLRATAARLDVLLLGPLSEIGERPLVVVPTGPLHSLPWSRRLRRSTRRLRWCRTRRTSLPCSRRCPPPAWCTSLPTGGSARTTRCSPTCCSPTARWSSTTWSSWTGCRTQWCSRPATAVVLWFVSEMSCSA